MKFLKKLDSRWYLENNPDVAASGMSAKEHYRHFGRFEGRRPCPPTTLERLYMRCRVILAVGRKVARREGGIWKLLTLSFEIFKQEGLKGLKQRILLIHNSDKAQKSNNDYLAWLRLNDADQCGTDFPSSVKISIVMATYNTPPLFLQKAIESVLQQTYSRWELCIADDASTDTNTINFLKQCESKDPRIKIAYRDTNGHISAATNTALEIVRGDYIAFMDHDDELHPAALAYIARAINLNPSAELIYSDEDKIDELGNRSSPYFKSNYNYELLLSQNMICHLAVLKHSLLQKIGGLRSEYNGAQDHDLVLRASEHLKPEQIVHIPKVLYHWRIHAASTAASTTAKPYAITAGRNAIQHHLDRVGLAAEVCAHPDVSFWHRVKFALPDTNPSIEIIIPTRDRIDLMRMCINSILDRTSYVNYGITIVDNGSIEPESLRQFAEWQNISKVKVIRDDSPFNYSRLNNQAVQQSAADYICLLNNDIEILSPDWLEEMVSHASRPGVGCVGARLWYPDDRLQHGGIVLGIGGVAGHSHKYLAKGQAGYFGRAVSLQAVSAVTGACLVIKRSIYDEVGGLDEQMKVAFNDVDFCLRVREAGYRNVWTPFAEMYHHESASRGQEDSPEKVARFRAEVKFMQDRWGDKLKQDPYYSPNLTLQHEDFSLAETSRFTLN